MWLCSGAFPGGITPTNCVTSRQPASWFTRYRNSRFGVAGSGVWWSGAEPDVKDVGEAAKGYNALALQHGADRNAKVVQERLKAKLS